MANRLFLAVIFKAKIGAGLMSAQQVASLTKADKYLLSKGCFYCKNSVPWNTFSGSTTYGHYLVRPSPVPIPAAVWLFGTALIGMVGFGKRRRVA